MSRTRRRWQAVAVRDRNDDGGRYRKVVTMAKRQQEDAKAENKSIEMDYGLAVR